MAGRKCECAPGFAGLECGVMAPCPNGCTEHGLCREGRCLCAVGWEGVDCSVAVTPRGCPNYCAGHGVCSAGVCGARQLSWPPPGPSASCGRPA